MSKYPQDYQVPRWITKNGQQGLRNFIDQLEVSRDLKYFESESDLIYSALSISGKPEIYSQLSTTEKGSVVEFSKYLHENYGMSMNELKRRFNRLQQDLNEGEQEFFLRIIKEYFNAKGIVRPADDEFSLEHKSDIQFQFLSGLRNNDLKRIMKLDLDDYEDDNTKFFQLGKICQRKALSLRELDGQVYDNRPVNTNGVFAIESGTSSESSSYQEEEFNDLQEIYTILDQLREEIEELRAQQ